MNFAVIFDMDGVIIDSNPYHKIAWKTFCEQHGFDLRDDYLEENIYGRTDKDALPILFNRQLDPELIQEYGDEINATYRDVYSPYIKPLNGFVNFLEMLKKNNIPYAIATSAPPVNVEYVLSHLKLVSDFNTIIDATQITNSKPDPEIYLTASSRLGIKAANCIVFEDSLSGIESAQAAGMKVVGLTTTHNSGELMQTDLIVDDFTNITVKTLEKLITSESVLLE